MKMIISKIFREKKKYLKHVRYNLTIVIKDVDFNKTY